MRLRLRAAGSVWSGGWPLNPAPAWLVVVEVVVRGLGINPGTICTSSRDEGLFSVETEHPVQVWPPDWWQQLSCGILVYDVARSCEHQSQRRRFN